MQIFLVIALCISLVTVIFALQNNSLTSVRFLFWQVNGSLALILISAFGLGVVVTFLASLPSLFRKNRIISRLKEKIEDLGGSPDLNDESIKLEDRLN